MNKIDIAAKEMAYTEFMNKAVNATTKEERRLNLLETFYLAIVIEKEYIRIYTTTSDVGKWEVCKPMAQAWSARIKRLQEDIDKV